MFGSGANKHCLDLAKERVTLPNPDGVCRHHFQRKYIPEVSSTLSGPLMCQNTVQSSSFQCFISLQETADTLVDLRDWKKHLEYISFGSGANKDSLDNSGTLTCNSGTLICNSGTLICNPGNLICNSGTLICNYPTICHSLTLSVTL